MIMPMMMATVVSMKNSPPADTVAAVHRAADGDPVLSPTVTRRLTSAADRAATRDRARSARAVLSEREREVLVAVANGRGNSDIATELHMSVATVKAHVSSMLAKLLLDNRTQVALVAHEAELS